MPTYPYDLTLVNPGGETGDMTGWTMISGSNGSNQADGADVPAHSGTRYFAGSSNAAASSWGQIVDVPSDAYDDVDAEALQVTASVYIQGYSGDTDSGTLKVDCLAADGTTVLATGTYGPVDPSAWSLIEATVDVPANTRKLHIYTVNTRNSGTQLSIYYDDFALKLDERPEPQTPHRYWRLRKTAGGNSCWSCATVEFRETQFSPDLRLTNPGTAFASSVYNNDGAYSADKAFDGNGGSFWHDACPGQSGSYIGYDFVNPVAVGGLAIQPRGGYPEQSPSGIVVEYSDDNIEWFVYATLTGLSWNGSVVTFGLAPPEPPLANRTIYRYSGDTRHYTVPAGATQVEFRMWGAGGHGGWYGGGSYGGGGALVSGKIPVSAGDVLTLQVGGGGRIEPRYTSASTAGVKTGGLGGWPDGGDGSFGDTQGGGGGGSSRIWKNGILMAVAGGGGGAAGYAGSGGAGGGPDGGNGQNGNTGGLTTGPNTSPLYGRRRARGVEDTRGVGRTGGYGGYMWSGTGEDGGGGGGGYYGGNGSGGDGRSAGGGSSYLHPSIISPVFTGGAGSSPGAPADPNYPPAIANDIIGLGVVSNQSGAGGSGAIVLAPNNGTLTPGGVGLDTGWRYGFDMPGSDYVSDRGNYTWRQRIDASQLKGGGTSIILNMRGGGNNGITITSAVIGRVNEWTENGNYTQWGMEYVETPTPITWDAGSPSVTIPTDQVKASDEIDFEFDEGESLMVTYYMTAGSGTFNSGESWPFFTGCGVLTRQGDYTTSLTSDGFSRRNNEGSCIESLQVYDQTEPTTPYAKRWRVYIYTSNGGQIGLGEIEMASSPGGIDLCEGGVFSASSTYGGGSFGTQNAFDNNLGTNWFAGQDGWAWVEYEFASPQPISEFRLSTGNDDVNSNPCFMAFQYYDEIALDWKDLFYGFKKGVWANSTTYTFTYKPPATYARHWAIHTTRGVGFEVNGNTYYDTVIREIEMRGSENGPDTTGSGTAYAYPENGSYPASNAFDNGTAIYYSGTAGRQSFIGYDFGSGAAVWIKEITIGWEAGLGNEYRAPGTGRVLCSNDGLSFFKKGDFNLSIANYNDGSGTAKFPVQVDGYVPPVLRRRHGVFVT